MKRLLILIGFLTTLQLSAQQKDRMLCILDISERNNETNDSRLFSLEQMANVAGVPTAITDDLNEALNYGVVLSTSTFAAGIFNGSERDLLSEYVTNGGILLAPRVSDSKLFELFGITATVDSKNRYTIQWQTEEDDKIFEWIDEEYEKEISLARSNQGDIYKTVAYELDNAQALGKYEDHGVAVSSNSFGQGTAYAFGLSWKEVILRNQINRDYEAQRISSNGFEPTQDVFFLILRSIFNKHIPYSTWKHTAPRNATSTLQITHDIDSRTGMDTLYAFVGHEEARGISATYNITVRYLGDETMSDFYNGNEDKLSYILNHGHVLGSHSVGHFPDFGDDDIFPIGTIGTTQDNYAPFNNGEVTTGGTLYGECEVSKNVLEAAEGQIIRTFRAGHLAYNKYLIDVLEDLGYEFNSNYAAPDVLTNFPYMNKKGRSFSGERSTVLEIPLAISDVFHSDPISSTNILDKVAIWEEVLLKNDANAANTCLLIHPNRVWKAEGQEAFLDRVPETVSILEIGDYGDFWNSRTAAVFHSILNDHVLTVVIDPNSYEEERISFIIDDGQDLEEVKIADLNGDMINLTIDPWGDNDLIAYTPAPMTTNSKSQGFRQNELKLVPNPTMDGAVTIELESRQSQQASINIYDINGKSIHREKAFLNEGIQYLPLNLSDQGKGIYIVEVNGNYSAFQGKLVLQ